MVVVAVGELNWPRAVGALGVDVCAATQQFIDYVELARHHRPMNGLVTSRVAHMEQVRRSIEKGSHHHAVVRANRRGD
jgi:hypothetical protein